MPSSPPYYAPVSSDEPEESSASTVAATAVGTGHHTFGVQGYSRLETMHGGNGSYLESTAFMAAGHAWRICCYLNGARPEDAGFVSVFLRRENADESVVHAEYEFALLHHQGTLIKWPSHCKRGTASAFHKRNSWGCPSFIAAEDLKRSKFLKDDCFAVRCKVTVVKVQAVIEDPEPAESTARMAFARFCGSICG